MNSLQLTLRQHLYTLKDDSYFKFSSKLNPGSKVMGVRMPLLRKTAKAYLKEPDKASLIIMPYGDSDNPFLEELMVVAILIAKLKLDNRLEKIDYFFRYLKGWALCDLLCAELDEAQDNLDLYWKYIYPKFTSNDNAQLRFAAVMSLNYFTDEKYLNEILDVISYREYSDYYVSMGVAWLVATLFVKHPEKIYIFLKEKKLYNLTWRQSLQKILDSYKVTKEYKTLIRELRRKK